MRFELTRLIRDPHSGAPHLPHECFDVFRRSHDSLDRELLYACFANGDSTILFPTDCEELNEETSARLKRRSERSDIWPSPLLSRS